jgi:hypothetical protein
MQHYERIDESATFDGVTRDSHEVRYRIARQFVGDTDVVLDAACGVGYGGRILVDGRPGVYWVGVDKNPAHNNIVPWDFNIQGPLSAGATGRPVDVFVGLEAIEHLDDDGVASYIHTASEARKFAIISTPVVRNSNPFHVQNFTEWDMERMFKDYPSWGLHMRFKQDDLYGIYIFKRHHE